jgi:2-oxoglutarate ferredoxin oxidoreductase subunit delta
MKLVIDENRCKGCNLCTKVCPYKIFKKGKKANRKRGISCPSSTVPNGAPTAGSRSCTGGRSCGVCQLTCPDQAITWVEEKPYERKKVAIEY